MEIEVLKSKIHRVTVTNCDLNYIGSITIDESLLEAANMIAGEKVQVVNINNGERLETYIINGKKGEWTLHSIYSSIHLSWIVLLGLVYVFSNSLYMIC